MHKASTLVLEITEPYAHALGISILSPIRRGSRTCRLGLVCDIIGQIKGFALNLDFNILIARGFVLS